MMMQDLATRHMVKYMSVQDRTLPIIALVDCDPYGLDIYSVYKWGSQVSKGAYITCKSVFAHYHFI